jgi:hypothetical protein
MAKTTPKAKPQEPAKSKAKSKASSKDLEQRAMMTNVLSATAFSL